MSQRRRALPPPSPPSSRRVRGAEAEACAPPGRLHCARAHPAWEAAGGARRGPERRGGRLRGRPRETAPAGARLSAFPPRPRVPSRPLREDPEEAGGPGARGVRAGGGRPWGPAGRSVAPGGSRRGAGGCGSPAAASRGHRCHRPRGGLLGAVRPTRRGWGLFVAVADRRPNFRMRGVGCAGSGGGAGLWSTTAAAAPGVPARAVAFQRGLFAFLT